MTSEKASVLRRKIDAAANRAAPSSNADAFAGELGALAAKAVGALLEAECAARAQEKSGALSAMFDAASASGIYYWLNDAGGEPCFFISVEPSFAGLMTTRLLGGELGEPAPSADATAVDFEMAASLVDVLTAPLNALLQKTSKTARIAQTGRRGSRVLKETLRERETLATCAFTIDLEIDGKPLPRAMTLVFARAFLDAAGVFSPSGPRTKALSPNWAPALRRNVLGIEIPLSVVLDRLMTSVGDLSRLQVGQVIDLDPNSLTALEIAAATSAGPANIARGRLGSWQSRKAVKLTTDIDQDFVRGL